ncbi:MAG: hypothetical protein FJ241_12290 [Nitrospira sp.]|nr:hypothetical protein [Nitrospira sp.]
MDKCPEKELLEKFIGNELSEEMNEKIFSHVEVCDKCKDTVLCLITKERNLLQSLSKSVSSRKKEILPSKSCLSKAAILAYATDCLDDKQLKLIESHIEKCDKCLTELMELQKKLSLPSEVELEMSVLRKKTKETVESEDILEIFLKIKGHILDLVRHTGELLHLKPLGAVRGKEPEKEGTFVIRKDLKDKDLSIEITIKKELNESGNSITISMMKLSTEEFISGIDVLLSGMVLLIQGKTNEHGAIEFQGIPAGNYEIKTNYGIIASIFIVG